MEDIFLKPFGIEVGLLVTFILVPLAYFTTATIKMTRKLYKKIQANNWKEQPKAKWKSFLLSKTIDIVAILIISFLLGFTLFVVSYAITIMINVIAKVF